MAAAAAARYVALARACAEAGDVGAGKLVHARAANEGLLRTFLANELLSMYGKCGDLDSATAIFRAMPSTNVFSWTLLMAANAQNGHPTRSLQLFWAMLADGLKPDRVCLLAAAASASMWSCCWRIRLCIVEAGLAGDLMLGNALVNMYGKCGSLDEALHIFQAMPYRNVVSWTTLMVALRNNHRGREALHCLCRMDAEGIPANNVTLLAAVDLCASMKLLQPGSTLHRRIIEAGLGSDPLLVAALVNMFGKCGNLTDMEAVFAAASNPTVSSWTAMLSAYVAAGESRRHDAARLVHTMDLEGVKPTDITYATMLEVCFSSTEATTMGARILESPFSNRLTLVTALLSLYGRLGMLDEARFLMDGMTNSSDVVVWNAMITACMHNGKQSEARLLMQNMQLMGVRPNKVTLLSILEACALTEGQAVHAHLMELLAYGGKEDDSVDLWNSLMNMYSKCGRLDEARRVFAFCSANIVSWNVMLSACILNGEAGAAVKLFRSMELQGLKANRVTLITLLDAAPNLASVRLVHERADSEGLVRETVLANALVSAYARCGELEAAKRALPRHRDIISWTALVTGYAQNRQPEAAVQLLHEMHLEGVAPGIITFVSALDACAAEVLLKHGQAIHMRAAEAGLLLSSACEVVSLGNALVNMYGKCGCTEEARSVFDAMPQRSAVSWHTLISAYATNGQVKPAQSALERMLLEGVPPDSSTFVALLCACSHAGLVAQAVAFFRSLADHSLVPTLELYKCIADLLGRKGLLDAAEELLLTEPSCQADLVAWTLLLAACKSYADTERGIRTAGRILELDAEHGPTYVLLSDLGRQCAALEEEEDHMIRILEI